MTIRGVLLDLGGVVYVGEAALPGALDALERLRASGLPVRCITNTTRQPQRLLLEKLSRLGVSVEPDELFMPALAARAYLRDRGLKPHLLVAPSLAEDFAGLPDSPKTAVVVGDAATGFTYESLNAAFRALEAGADFLALARNRSFQDEDGAHSLDAGPFVAALEYAAGRQALVLGKPSPPFFRAAVDSLGCNPGETAMVGDDVEADIGGAMAAGLRGVLVQTGKYRPGDEDRIDPPPDAVAAGLSQAVDWILARA